MDVFESTLRMPTYLLAFVVCDYVPQEKNDSKGRTFRVWTRAGQESSGRYALQLSIRVLNYFEELLGMPYPLKKLDHVPVPDFPAGAMENWGCITYKESALLYDEAQPNIRLQQQVAIIVTHELAHQVRSPSPFAPLSSCYCPAPPPLVVRQPGHDEVVERHLAERGLRQLHAVPRYSHSCIALLQISLPVTYCFFSLDA